MIPRLLPSLLAMVLTSAAASAAAEKLEPFSVDPGLLGGAPGQSGTAASTPAKPTPPPPKPAAKTRPAPTQADRPPSPETAVAQPATATAPPPAEPAVAGTNAPSAADPAAVAATEGSIGAAPPAGSPASRPSKPAKASAPGIAGKPANGTASLYEDPDYQPLQHTPASLREWSGATHDGPVLRRITPNPRGLPVEGEPPGRGKARKGLRPSEATGERTAAGSLPPAEVPAARTSLRGMEPFEVDPALLGAPPGAGAARSPGPVAAPTLQRAEAPAGVVVTRGDAPGDEAPGKAKTAARAAPPPESRTRPSAGLEPFVVDPALLGQAPTPPAPAATAALAPATAPETRRTAPGGGTLGAVDAPGASGTRQTSREAGRAIDPPPTLTQAGDANLEIEARRIEGAIDQSVTATGEAYIRKGWDELFGDVLRWNVATRESSGEGNIVKRDRDTEVTGTQFVFNQDTRKGKVDEATFSVKSVDGKGTAGSLRFDGPGRLIGDEGVKYTTCDFNDPDWLLKADNIEIDQNTNEGVARNATILAGGKYPVFYLPRYQFALKNIRKSGFITPLVGITNRTGPQIFIPYYWNIAPNYDATITTRLMTTRGLQIGGEFRYLQEGFGGEARAEYVPDDRQFGDHRWALAFDHRHSFSERLSGLIDYQQVSDDFYLRDLRNTIGASGASATGGNRPGTDPGAVPGVRGGTATRLLAQSALLDYAGDGWNLSSQIRSFQVLQPDRNNPVIQPYQALPNVRFSGAQRIAGLADGKLLADFTAYSLRYQEPGITRREGNRTILNPTLSVPLRTTWGFIEPKVGYHMTYYSLDPIAGLGDTFTRSVPTATLDSGLTFERKASDDGAVQTFEPRLFYAYVPFRDQTQLPVFDTGRFDFNFAEIFSANRFVGNDRIGDANQVTAGFTTRYIDGQGTERAKVTLAQRFTLSDLKVVDDIRSIVDRSMTPPGAVAAPQRGVSDVLGEFSGRVTRDTSLITRVQYNTDTTEVQRGLFSLRYNPEMGKVINVGYRYAREISDAQLGLQQVDFSTQWPITSNLYALARTNYSLLESRSTESLFGLEYYGSCWSVRTVVQSLATSATTTTRALFIVLELNGLTGTDPSTYNAILNRHIGGYSTITPDQNRTTDAMIQ